MPLDGGVCVRPGDRSSVTPNQRLTSNPPPHAPSPAKYYQHGWTEDNNRAILRMSPGPKRLGYAPHQYALSHVLGFVLLTFLRYLDSSDRLPLSYPVCGALRSQLLPPARSCDICYCTTAERYLCAMLESG